MKILIPYFLSVFMFSVPEVSFAQNIILVPIKPGYDISGNWSLEPAILPEAKVNEVYSHPFLGLISKPSYLGFIWSSVLPPSVSSWATLDPVTGLLSGTPTAEDTIGTDFTITAARNGKTDSQTYTIKVAGVELNVLSISSGLNHTCAVTKSGGAKCWGNNSFGSLGDGTNTSRLTPADVFGLTSGVRSISVGQYHTCAVTNSGAAKCWGYNGFGQLGDGTTNQRLTVTDVSGLGGGVSSISSSYSHTCASLLSGGIKCWGNGQNGRLGNGSTAQRLYPTDVNYITTNVLSLSSGSSHTCAVTSDNDAKCWGTNNWGQLGDGTSTERVSPVNVNGMSGVTSQISSGKFHTCATTTGNSAMCWGYNGNGHLGDGTYANKITPANVIGLTSNVSSVTASSDHSCAVKLNGEAMCWGWNSNGRLGDGTNAQKSSPVSVIGVSSVASKIMSIGAHNCVTLSDDSVKCWGSNLNGQLGDGTTNDRSSPVPLSL